MTDPAATAIVFLGGDRVPAGTLDDLPTAAFVIGADSGVDHAHALGWEVDLAVGDFDSVTPAGLAAVEDAGATVDRHPAEKDQTDFELALDVALGRGAQRIVVIGGHGGRVDHFLGNAMVLVSDRFRAATIEARFGHTVVHVVRGAVAFTGTPGDLVTLLAVTGPVTGITTTGLRYPLAGETLVPGSSRGVSNELLARSATVTVGEGVLLVVRPGSAG